MLYSHFAQVLSQYAVAPSHIVLALSGGMDSRVLLDLLAMYRDLHPQHTYLAVHVHHGISANADSWLAQCQTFARQADIPFVYQKVQVISQGEGLESAARKLRYQAISRYLQRGSIVLTGQHSDDQAETFLLALKRGSGLAGLASMPQVRDFGLGVMVRPLLHVSREEIENYAKERELTWVEDESNQDCRFDRNFIRHQWLPVAKARWPSVVKTINRTAALCAQQQALLDELLLEHDKKVQQDDGSVALDVLRGYSKPMQMALLRRWLDQRAQLNLTQAQLQQLLQSVIEAAPDANPKLLQANWQLRRFQHSLFLLPLFADVTTWQAALTPPQTLQLPDNIGTLSVQSYQDCGGLGLNAQILSAPLSVRFDPQGIFAHPVERQGKRKLKKLFQEYGVPSWQRRRVPLLFCGEQLAAVADLFVCQHFSGQEWELIWHKS
ncbi:MAG: tRNA lysidine(34) synthetase TilS [Vibrionaceae bacterium]